MTNKDSVKKHIQYIIHDLDTVESDLRSAKGWGIFDILGGDSISSIVKHSKINRAEKNFKKLLRELNILQDELTGLNINLDPNFNVDGLNRFLDIFMDNIFSDLLTQSKINESIRKVEDLKTYLYRLYKNI